MLVNRATVRRILSGEPQEQVDPALRTAALDDLSANPDALPAGGGLPLPKQRIAQGRASPLTQQARTGRAGLLGDR